MRGRYRDIINLPRRPSIARNRMSRHGRAAQFAPFAALTGYDAAICETARLTDDMICLDEDKCAEINFQLIAARDSNNVMAEIIYFVPDKRKHGGAWKSVTGIIYDIDTVYGVITLDGGRKIPLSAVCDVKINII